MLVFTSRKWQLSRALWSWDHQSDKSGFVIFRLSVWQVGLCGPETVSLTSRALWSWDRQSDKSGFVVPRPSVWRVGLCGLGAVSLTSQAFCSLPAWVYIYLVGKIDKSVYNLLLCLSQLLPLCTTCSWPVSNNVLSCICNAYVPLPIFRIWEFTCLSNLDIPKLLYIIIHNCYLCTGFVQSNFKVFKSVLVYAASDNCANTRRSRRHLVTDYRWLCCMHTVCLYV